MSAAIVPQQLPPNIHLNPVDAAQKYCAGHTVQDPAQHTPHIVLQISRIYVSYQYPSLLGEKLYATQFKTNSSSDTTFVPN